MNLKNTLMIVALASMPGWCAAQSITTDFDKKVIMTDSLNMPENTSMNTLLKLLPELLQRPKDDYLYSNYDIQIEDMSVEGARDVALQQLQILDVEKIEVSESPVSSYTNHGQGGVINIILRSESKQGKDTWGTAGFNMQYPLDIAPQLNIGYKKDKFMVRGLAFGEVYNNSSDIHIDNFSAGKWLNSEDNSFDKNFATQLARVYLQYSPTPNDILKWNVSEVYIYVKEHTSISPVGEMKSEEKDRTTDLRTLFNYKHTFPRSEFVAEVEYLYSPVRKTIYGAGGSSVLANNNGNTLSGKMEYKTHLLPAVHDGDTPQSLQLTVGSVFSNNLSHQTIGGIVSAIDPYKEITPKTRNQYWMPYGILEGQFGKLGIKLMTEYQHQRFRITRSDTPYNVVSDDITGKFMTTWNFSLDKKLRLTIDRKLDRPSDEQLYPVMLFDPLHGGYVKGNSTLDPMMSHEMGIDYLANYKWGNGHSLLVNAGVSYNFVTDIITNVTSEAPNPSSGDFGYSLQCLTFRNNGKSNILNANLMALYNIRSFFLSFTGNVYHNDLRIDGIKNHYTYYNLSIYPHFTLKDGWHGGAKLEYYSQVEQKDSKLSDCAGMQMQVGKSWDNFFVYLYQATALQKHAKDTQYLANGVTNIRQYEMWRNTVGVGIKYSF